jgi:hypothetical protein
VQVWESRCPLDGGPTLGTFPGVTRMATVASVGNLERQIRRLTDWFVTPWGTAASQTAYLGLSAKHMLPATVALARRGNRSRR